jgi:hypothetical protein
MRQQLDDVAADFVGECFEDHLGLARCGRSACRIGTRASHTQMLAQKLIIFNDLFHSIHSPDAAEQGRRRYVEQHAATPVAGPNRRTHR